MTTALAQTDTLPAGFAVRILPGAFSRIPGASFLLRNDRELLGVVVSGPDADGDYLVDVDGVGRGDFAPECFA